VNFVSVRVITDDVRRLVEFYEQCLQTTAEWSTPDFAELATRSCTLAIASARTMALFDADLARPADNHSVIIEFRVADVDHDYRRLAHLVDEVVQTPTTMPWGNRSLLFRDPDGNLVNFFTPVTVAAEERQQR